MAAAPHPHGTRPRYQSGCRCADCTRENTQYQREYRSRTTPRSVSVTSPGGYRYDQLTLVD